MIEDVNDRAADTLDGLVAPMFPSEFHARHWDRGACSLRSPGRSWDRLGVTLDTVLDAVADGRLTARVVTTEVHGDVVTPLAGRPTLPLRPGSTLCVNHVDRVFPEVAALCRSVINGLGLAGSAFSNLYYSAEEHGFEGHFDTQAVFVVQLAGSKFWRFGPVPVIPWPPVGCTEGAESMQEFRDEYPSVPIAAPSDMQEVLLEPGDVLFLPAGTWHRARAAGGTSLALALTVLPCSAWELITRALEPRLRAEAAWRRDIASPLAVPVDGLPPSVEAHLRERIETLRWQLAELTPEDLHRAWRVQRGSAGAARWHGDALDPEATLAHSNGIAPGYQVESESLRVLHTGCVIELDPAAEPFVRALATHPRFCARDALAWDEGLTWGDVAPLLETMLRQGVLVIEGP